MRLYSHTLFALTSGAILGLLPLPLASADDSNKASDTKQASSPKKAGKVRAKAEKAAAKLDQEIPDTNLLDAMRDGLIAVDAEGRGDGRMKIGRAHV